MMRRCAQQMESQAEWNRVNYASVAIMLQGFLYLGKAAEVYLKTGEDGTCSKE